MEQSAYNVRLEPGLLRQLDVLCEEYGVNVTAALDIIVRTAIREKKIPMEVKKTKKLTLDDGRRAFEALREQARRNGLQDMTLEEINEEIRLARLEAEEKQ